MKLLIDAGNSRIKWAIASNGNLQSNGKLQHSQVNELGEICHNNNISEIWGSIVASEALRQAIENACQKKIHWVNSERERYGVYNHYQEVSEQGSDRWLAVLALHEKKSEDVILASLGTALTVEALSAEGDYLGGLIIPGLHLMIDSLAKGTANLQRLPGSWSAFPRTTSEAITSGALDAMSGAITRMRERLAARTKRPVSVVLTGGNAALLLPLLTPPCQIMDNLVIHGLLKISSTI